MGKEQVVNQFIKSLIKEKQRKNKISFHHMTSILIIAAVTLTFINESCPSSVYGEEKLSNLPKARCKSTRIIGFSLGFTV